MMDAQTSPELGAIVTVRIHPDEFTEELRYCAEAWSIGQRGQMETFNVDGDLAVKIEFRDAELAAAWLQHLALVRRG